MKLGRKFFVLQVRKLHNWMMAKAKHPRGAFFLSIFSFCESIFFPIPIDPFLLALCAARPSKALRLSFLVTCFSVFGAFFGYFIGFFFWDQFQSFVYSHWAEPERVGKIFLELRSGGFWALFFSALTPVPYKVFAFASGVVQLDLLSFFLGSFLGRFLRFMSIGSLFHFYGKNILAFIESYFEKIVLSLSAFCLIFLVIWLFL